MLIRGGHRFFNAGPLYNVIVNPPANETKVPRTFAIPRGLPISRASSLSRTAITKVTEAMVLTIEETKVGEVYLKLKKYMFRDKHTPRREIMNISTKSINVSLDLCFLSRK
uniref:Uncharacterized protein n=1 Tax=Rhizophora mucronata TaxID=61149 RepID=A0A2P2Q5L3_RHIMU